MSMLDAKSERMKAILDRMEIPEHIRNAALAPVAALPEWANTQPINKMPPWFFDYNPSQDIINITPEGMIYARLCRHIGPRCVMGDHINKHEAGMFSVGRWTCVRAFPCINADTNEEAFAVVSIVDRKPVLMYDDKNLFPSDGLVAGILLFDEPETQAVSYRLPRR